MFSEANIGFSSRIYYEIAANCNLRCVHCSDLTKSNNEFLDVSRLLEFHRSLSKYGIRDSVISGGEPALHPEYLLLVKELADIGSVLVTTNGTISNQEDQVRLLRDNPNVILQISLDGISQCTFDSIRGEGNFDKVMSLLNILIENNLHRQVGLSMTVLNCNAHEVKPMIDYARSINVNFMHFPVLLPVGNAQGGWSRLAPDFIKQTEIDEILLNATNQKSSTKISVNRFDQLLAWTLGGDDCLTRFTLKVDPRGFVHPCPVSGNESLAIGNILDSGLADDLILNIKRKQKVFSALAPSMQDRCLSCRVNKYCGGRFCENCGILTSVMEPKSINRACNIVRYHLERLIDECEGEIEFSNQ